MVESTEFTKAPEHKPIDFVSILTDPTLQQNQAQLSMTMKEMEFGDLCLDED